MHRHRRQAKPPRALGLIGVIWFIVWFIGWSGLLDQSASLAEINLAQTYPAQTHLTQSSDPAATQPPFALPPLQAHALPPSLAQWQTLEQGDYFDAIQPTELGYLIWSVLPVKVYIQPGLEQPVGQTTRTSSDLSRDTWYAAVSQAVQEWAIYLPLTISPDPETADITILRSAPPLQRLNPGSSNRLPRIRAAETHYDFFVRQKDRAATLFQRFTIHLSPSQTADYTLATIRHELGHALGIWGHSPLQTDALYFSQVRTPASISPRDINTLKRIYQQPTRLGWQVALPDSADQIQQTR